MSENRIALIGDIVASRGIRERTAFDDVLLSTLRDLNKREHISSRYTLIGDEIQAVFHSADMMFHDAFSILSTIHPKKMRFAFGVGILVTPINPLQAIEMDGPAFHNARDGVEKIKDQGHLFTLVGEDIPRLALLRTTLVFVSHNVNKWNKTRLQTAAMLLRGMKVREIAEKLEVSDKTIYKTVSAGALDTLVHLFTEIQNMINEAL